MTKKIEFLKPHKDGNFKFDVGQNLDASDDSAKFLVNQGIAKYKEIPVIKKTVSKPQPKIIPKFNKPTYEQIEQQNKELEQENLDYSENMEAKITKGVFVKQIEGEKYDIEQREKTEEKPVHELIMFADLHYGQSYIPMRFVEMCSDLNFHLKCPVSGSGGDVLFKYMPPNGIYENRGVPWAQQALQTILGDAVSSRKQSETINQLRIKNYVEADNFKQNSDYVILPNGAFNLKTGELEAFSPTHNAKALLGATYDKDAKCPLFIKFINEVLPGDEEMIQEVFGYLLSTGQTFEKCFVFVGEGSNGKGVLFDVIKAFLGETNCSGVSLHDLVKDRFSVADLYGKLANIAGDVGQYELKNTGLFKKLTSRDSIRGQFKNMKAFDFYNNAKLLLACNMLPKSPDQTYAYFRRFEIFIFKNKYVLQNEYEEEKEDPNVFLRDTNLPSKLTTKEEISGLFNWAYDGYKRLFEQGFFTKSRTTKETQELYEEMSTPPIGFVKHCINVDSFDEHVSKDVLHRAFYQYCKKIGAIPTPKNKFTPLLKDLVYVEEYTPTVDKKRVPSWRGISLRCDPKREICKGCKGCNGSLPLKKIEKKSGSQSTLTTVTTLTHPNLNKVVKRLLTLMGEMDQNVSIEEMFEAWGEELGVSSLEEFEKIILVMAREGTIFSHDPGFWGIS